MLSFVKQQSTEGDPSVQTPMMPLTVRRPLTHEVRRFFFIDLVQRPFCPSFISSSQRARNSRSRASIKD